MLTLITTTDYCYWLNYFAYTDYCYWYFWASIYGVNDTTYSHDCNLEIIYESIRYYTMRQNKDVFSILVILKIVWVLPRFLRKNAIKSWTLVLKIIEVRKTSIFCRIVKVTLLHLWKWGLWAIPAKTYPIIDFIDFSSINVGFF